MRITVLGTGAVGRTLSAKFHEVGHGVTLGTRDVASTLARDQPDQMGNPPFADWHRANPDVGLAAYSECAELADLVVNATAGASSLEALRAVGQEALAGKVVMDVANPLDFSGGFPPTLSVCNTDSLAEGIQRGFPTTSVVKALNTMNVNVMVDPGRLPGEHVAFVAGDDADAKETVGQLLRDMGWSRDRIVDLGGIRAARGLEMYLPLWVSMMQTLGTGDFNIGIVRS